MGILQPLLLGLGLLLPGDPGAQPAFPTEDPARLREMLYDSTNASSQSQAALMLVQDQRPDAVEIVRRGLRQTDDPDVFLALAAALKLTRDIRFTDELLDGLSGGRPTVRQAAAETLAVVCDTGVVLRLQALIENPRVEPEIRQQAVAALGRSGKKAAMVVLLEQLNNAEQSVARAAADALADQTGVNYGLDAARWRAWWQAHRDRPNEQWLEERLGYQSSRARRLEGELDRAKSQLVQLHQQLYQRLPVGDRLGHVQSLADSEDACVRSLAVTWSMELLPQADTVGQRALSNALIRLSHDGDVTVQRAATLTLGRIADPRAFDQLRRLLATGKPSVRAAASHALTQQTLTRTPGVELAPETGLRNPERVRQVVPLLQKALDDPALEVVVAAAEDLGALGVPEAGPVLAGLLRHQSESVRQTAAQALERVADPTVLDNLLASLEDPAVTVRFGLVGALGKLVNEGKPLTDGQRSRMLTRLEELLLRDPDSGVRSRAATVIGQTGAQVELPFLWRRLQAREDGRVLEKTWGAMIEIMARSANLELVRQWDRALYNAQMGNRRLQLLSEVAERWKRNEGTRNLGVTVTELLVQAQLDQNKWAAAFPLLHDLLERPGTADELDRRLRWLLKAGEKALLEGNRSEALRAVREAQPFLARSNGLAVEFEKLDQKARDKQ
ncbi:MAG: HEAT repeat domain-containing protein [Planctomycetia bacterium]|nr:HEAT repeat domain-containing protein [Planctomycetia bacterium]